jgi:predicted ATP-dependent endonuclease of OLD family
MKLIAFEVAEFRSVWDSNSVEVGDVTCLVGKNEAGKTALLTALYKLNPIIPEDNVFDVTDDYPRKEVGDYQHQVASIGQTGTGPRRVGVGSHRTARV